MAPRAITITQADREWHEAFLTFVPKVFPRISFRRWYEYGGWTERYLAFAVVDGEQIIANASLMRMDLVLNGQVQGSWQLGAVGTLPELRGQGLQRQLLPRLLEHAGPEDPLFLFANHHVLDFYPRFGFRRAREWLFQAEHAVQPKGKALEALDITRLADRALLSRVAAAAEPVTELVGARNYGTTLLWHWANFFRHGLRYLPEHDAIIAIDQRDATLTIYDVLSAEPFELARYLPQLIGAPIQQLEFGFTPTRFWPSAEVKADYTDSPLFVRGPIVLPEQPFKYPMLAQT